MPHSSASFSPPPTSPALPVPVIHCVGVTKQYGERDDAVFALRGIHLEVFAGELFMLVGPSGCGKTTLISIIAGILDASSGECEVLSRNLARISSREKILFRAHNIGFVFQAYNLLPALTAAENVAVPLLINGMARREAVQRAELVLEKVGLSDKRRMLPSQLSGGQQQRVAIARALVHRPKIIVCDEPTSALDHKTGQRVIELMQSLVREEGSTLVIVTHDSRIFQYADRIAEMDDGKILHISSPQNLTGAHA